MRFTVLCVFLLSSFSIGFCDENSQPVKKEIFKFIRTIQVTPDAKFQTGSFARINYVPANDHFIVTFGVKSKGSAGNCLGAGYAFKEYNLEMKETGKNGFFIWAPGACEAYDSGSFMIGNDYYFVWIPADRPGFYGWRILKFDASSWKKLEDVYYPLIESKERLNDPMVFFTDGQLDVSGQFDASGKFAELFEGAATQHSLFTPNLKVINKMILKDSPHVCGSSMIVVDGIRYYVTANAFLGDLVVMKYDLKWNYLGMIPLIKEAHWSQGVVFDGKHFFVTYLSTSQRTNHVLPVYLNAHLAVFDKDWNLLYDEAITNYLPKDHRQPGRPWVILHNNFLYVSYDIDTIDPKTNQEQLKWQAYVSIYKLK